MSDKLKAAAVIGGLAPFAEISMAMGRWYLKVRGVGAHTVPRRKTNNGRS